jgi:exodeoxyribonuclease V alpha subunit
VGPATAKKIVKKFGRETLEILARSPEKLSTVSGISEQKAARIGAGYREISEMQDAIMYFCRFEISLNMAVKIYKHYGAAAVAAVSKNPYSLIETIDGIGFLTADKMAKTLGVSHNSGFRVRAGIVYCLAQSAETDGNTYLPLPLLAKSVCRLLQIKTEQLVPVFNGIINELCLDRVTVPADIDGVAGIMLTKFFNAEKIIAQKINLLKSAAGGEMPEKGGAAAAGAVGNGVTAAGGTDALIAHYEKLNNIVLHENQKNAIRTAVTAGFCVITGGPGTGKTTIIKAILFINRANGKTTQLLAPTGRAAKRICETTGADAQTIHRCLDMDYRGGVQADTNGADGYIGTNFVLVDEVSMCDAVLTAQLLRKVMAGTHTVFVGDIDQLPSVGAGNVLADIIDSGIVPVVRLTEIYRQSDKSTIALNARRINCGEIPALDNKSSDFFFEYAETPEKIRDAVVSLTTARLPKYLGADSGNIQVLAPLKLGSAGVNNLNLVLQSALNPENAGRAQYVHGGITFRTGDRVMHTVNNYKQEWTRAGENGKGVFNGDIGVIREINPDDGEITVELEDGRRTVYLRSDLSALTLSYAITVHKSQGCEFDAVIVPVTSGAYMIMTRNLLYTAVTRAFFFRIFRFFTAQAKQNGISAP